MTEWGCTIFPLLILYEVGIDVTGVAACEQLDLHVKLTMLTISPDTRRMQFLRSYRDL